MLLKSGHAVPDAELADLEKAEAAGSFVEGGAGDGPREDDGAYDDGPVLRDYGEPDAGDDAASQATPSASPAPLR
jgi:hypothetical protein